MLDPLFGGTHREATTGHRREDQANYLMAVAINLQARRKCRKCNRTIHFFGLKLWHLPPHKGLFLFSVSSFLTQIPALLKWIDHATADNEVSYSSHLASNPKLKTKQDKNLT